jgi:hypothetical protein
MGKHKLSQGIAEDFQEVHEIAGRRTGQRETVVPLPGKGETKRMEHEPGRPAHGEPGPVEGIAQMG